MVQQTAVMACLEGTRKTTHLNVTLGEQVRATLCVMAGSEDAYSPWTVWCAVNDLIATYGALTTHLVLLVPKRPVQSPGAMRQLAAARGGRTQS
jgi:hypothetical protein